MVYSASTYQVFYFNSISFEIFSNCTKYTSILLFIGQWEDRERIVVEKWCFSCLPVYNDIQTCDLYDLLWPDLSAGCYTSRLEGKQIGNKLSWKSRQHRHTRLLQKAVVPHTYTYLAGVNDNIFLQMFCHDRSTQEGVYFVALNLMFPPYYYISSTSNHLPPEHVSCWPCAPRTSAR